MHTAETKIQSIRGREIVIEYLQKLDDHISELREGKAERSLEIQDFAEMLHIHPRHLSNTLHEITGRSPCDLFEERLIKISKELLRASGQTIGSIAHQLHYDPSNFTKFFKNYTGMTPKQFRSSAVEF